MVDDDGKITASPNEMAGILQKHWAKVFARRLVDQGLLPGWLQDAFMQDGHGRTASGLLDPKAKRWRIRRQDVVSAIKSSGNTMPGPDCIPYKAWRSLGTLAVDTLFAVVQSLSAESAVTLLNDAHAQDVSADSCSFNESTLCCLPKKYTGVDIQHLPLARWPLSTPTIV